MLKRIKSEASKIASFIWSLPGPVKYPLIGLLAIILPSIAVMITLLGISVAVAISPMAIAFITVWYFANRVDE